MTEAVEDTSAARERTALAWQRTALTAVALATAVARLGPGAAWVRDVAAATLIAVAAVCAVCGRLRVTRQSAAALPAPLFGVLGLGIGLTGVVLAVALATGD